MSRLKQLVKNGYIKVIDKTDNGENVYCVTKKTVKILDVEYECLTKTDKLHHHLACADFYFSIKNKSPLSYINDPQFYFLLNGKKYSFRPDIVVKIDRWYIVEIDLCNRRFEDKIKTWERYYNSGEFVKKFEKYPPIIIVSTNMEKVKNIIDKNKNIELNYVYRNYEEVKGWYFRYEL